MRSTSDRNLELTEMRASSGHSWNQSMLVQLTMAGNLRALTLSVVPTGEKHSTTCIPNKRKQPYSSVYINIHVHVHIHTMYSQWYMYIHTYLGTCTHTYLKLFAYSVNEERPAVLSRVLLSSRPDFIPHSINYGFQFITYSQIYTYVHNFSSLVTYMYVQVGT